MQGICITPASRQGRDGAQCRLCTGSCAAGALPVAVASAHVPGSGTGGPVKHITSCQPLLCQGGGCGAHMRIPYCHGLKTGVLQHRWPPMQFSGGVKDILQAPIPPSNFLSDEPTVLAGCLRWSAGVLLGALVICARQRFTQQSSGLSRERPCASPSRCTPRGCAYTPPAGPNSALDSAACEIGGAWL